jgi:acyl-CoA synthetase (NDP forming)
VSVEPDPWDSFFRPRVVSVVGASSDPDRIGGRLVRYSLEAGFAGRVVPVNPRRDAVFGLPTLRNLRDIDTAPDWVVVAVPRDQVLDVVADAAAVGARNVSVVAAGFAELDAAGRDLQAELAAAVRRNAMRLLGPNSNGFMHVDSGAFFAFTPVLDSARPTEGPIAVVTQSAAVGTYVVNWCRRSGLGIRHWVHTGNEADLTALEVVEQLALRGEVRAVALSFESLRDVHRLEPTLSALAEAAVSVGVLQAGLTPTGKRASEAHTAALIGDETALVQGLLRQAGVFTSRSIAELMHFLQLAVHDRGRPRYDRVGIMSTSGGIGILMADAAESNGLAMPTLSAGLQRRIRGYAPFAHPANPVDTTAQVINEPAAYERMLRDCAGSGELDHLGVFIAHGLAGLEDPTLRTLLAVATRDTGPVDGAAAALAAIGLLPPEACAALQSAGVSCFPEPADMARAVRAYSRAAAARAAFATDDRARGGGGLPLTGRPPGDRRLGHLDELQSKQFLARLGATVPAHEVAASAADAAAAAERLGFPVVLKLVSPDLVHKARHGGVRLDLLRPDEVRSAYDALADLARHRAGTDGGWQVLVERQVRGVEVFVGATRHPGLGPIVGIGRGGVDVEEAGGVSWTWGPVTSTTVADALPPQPRLSADQERAVAEVANLLLAVVRTPQAHVRTVETNPVIVTRNGEAVVVDAYLLLDPDDRQGAPG